MKQVSWSALELLAELLRHATCYNPGKERIRVNVVLFKAVCIKHLIANPKLNPSLDKKRMRFSFYNTLLLMNASLQK